MWFDHEPCSMIILWTSPSHELYGQLLLCSSMSSIQHHVFFLIIANGSLNHLFFRKASSRRYVAKIAKSWPGFGQNTWPGLSELQMGKLSWSIDAVQFGPHSVLTYSTVTIDIHSFLATPMKGGKFSSNARPGQAVWGYCELFMAPYSWWFFEHQLGMNHSQSLLTISN